MQNHFEAGSTHTVVRRRRTRRHRRNRLVRRALLLVALVAGGFTLSSVALRYLSPSLFRSSRAIRPQPGLDAAQNLLVLTGQEALSKVENRPVYPYSVVPGGVQDAQELKWAAEHDPVVAEHYAGFDYDHARVVRLVLARTAYLSYRIGNKIYWTRHRVSLKKGETVITDGRMTARTRCANRVEEMPQQATSSSEPPATKFEEPVHPATGTAMEAPPVPFQSALLDRPKDPGFGPGSLAIYDPFDRGSVTPMTPPPLPSVCGIGKKKTPEGTKKKKGDPCGNGPGGGGEVPEPSTWMLMGTGLAFLAWATRRRLAKA